MQISTLEQAAARPWDCILVGTSFAAMFFALGLKRKHPRLSVLFIERGQFASHQQQIADQGARRYEDFSQTNTSRRDKVWVASKLFGGNSNCWSGCTPRQTPSDFRMRSRYGIGVDWPLSYADLEPFYCDVEDVMEVAGGGTEHLMPRSRPFPHLAHAPSMAEVQLRAHDPDIWTAQATARSNGGSRPNCCANALCSLCPVDAKFTILTGLDHFLTDQTHVLLGHECRSVTTSAGRASGVVVRDSAGREHELRAPLIGLGANAVQNAAILLRSGVNNPLIGRGIVEQSSQLVTYNIPFPNYFGGTHITGNGYGCYESDFVSEKASVLIEVRNDLLHARPERGKWLNNMRLKFIAADIPNPENRVTLKGDEPHIEWSGHSAYSLAGLAHAIEATTAALPFDAEITATADYAPTESHIQGMAPMATRREDGVVDQYCEVFGLGGLHALGAGAFPTCPAANPTLTLSALSLRSGQSV